MLNKKNPLENKKWLKEFSEELKKAIRQSALKKTSPSGWVNEINCSQKDIGKPNYLAKKSKK